MFKVEMQTDNEAFDLYADGEVRRILQKICDDLENGISHGSCIDTNGNKVGEWSLE